MEPYKRTHQKDRMLPLLHIFSVRLVVKKWVFLYLSLQLNEFNFSQIRTEISEQQVNPSCLHGQLSKQTSISVAKCKIVILEINVVFPVCFELDLHVSLLGMFVCMCAVIYLFVCLFVVNSFCPRPLGEGNLTKQSAVLYQVSINSNSF